MYVCMYVFVCLFLVFCLFYLSFLHFFLLLSGLYAGDNNQGALPHKERGDGS